MGNAACKQNCADYFVWFCRIWGIASALVLWGIGIEIAFDKEIIGYYIIGVACIMSALETVFLVHLLVKECHGELSKSCTNCWGCMITVDDWKKSILYILLSVFCLVRNFLLQGEAWLSIIAGTMLVLAAVFYFIKSFTDSKLEMVEGERHATNNTYSRIDRTGEDLGSGSITNDMPPQSDTISIQSGAALLSNAQDRSLAEQDGIMEA